MASNKVEMENSDQQLKHLGFVRMIAINAVICVSNLYEYAKQNSGALKSTIGNVESAAITVVGPVYEKFKGVPSDVLVFLDTKVDEATNKLDELAPPLAKQLVREAQSMIQKLSNLARYLGQVSQVGGPCAAIHYANTFYKESVLIQLAKVWYGVNQISPLNVVAQMAVPTATHLSKKYNKALVYMAAKGYTIFRHFPLVPIDDMSKAYKQVEATKERKAAGERETELVS